MIKYNNKIPLIFTCYIVHKTSLKIRVLLTFSLKLLMIQFNSIFIIPIIKHKEYNIHVMSCAPVKEEFKYTVLWVFYNEVEFQKSRAYPIGLSMIK